MAFGHLSSGRAAKLVALALCFSTIILAYPLITSTDSASAAQVTVAWDPDTSPGLAGYKVYWGTVSRNYSWSADASSQTAYTVPSLSEGATYYFAATAYDATRTESTLSNEVTYTVPSACTYTISPAGQSFGAGGGTSSTAVTTGAGCNWTTSNSASWISITSGGSGKGNGTVTYSAAANTGTATRMAGLTVAGRTFTVTQAGIQTYTLGISTSGAGSGTVTSSPTGTTFNAGTSVTLTATPGTNSTFAGWSGACSGTATLCMVTMNSNLSVGAAFNVRGYTITVGAGTGGSISPSGSLNVNGNSSQTFTITPTTGYKVANVLVDGASVGAVSSYTFTSVSASHTIQASFAQSQVSYTLTITKSGAGSGTVTSSPTGTTFNAGTSVTLTATPGTNSTFAGWSGACSGTGTCNVTMNASKSVTATFNAQATNYTNPVIANYSFEAAGLTQGGAYTTTCPSGWTCTSGFSGGVYRPVSNNFPPGSDGLTGNKIVPDGNLVAYIEPRSAGSLGQSTGATIANNTAYTLDVWAGRRNDFSGTFTPTIQLMAGSTPIATLALSDPGSGKWREYTLTYIAGASDPNFGKTLGIQLNRNGSSIQVNFDLVTVTAVPTVGHTH